MSRPARRLAWLLIFVALLSLGCGGSAPPEAPAEAPEPTDPLDSLERTHYPLVLISLDTTRLDHCSVYGYHLPTTPHLEELAKDAIVFEQAIAAHTNTAPSHATMMSGLPPIAHGSLANGSPIADEVDTLAERLRRSGYRSGAFVSAGTLRRRHSALGQGFEVYEDNFATVRREGQKTLDRTLPWLREIAAEPSPFFLFFHTYDPHYPYLLRPGFEDFGLAEGQVGMPPDEEPMGNHGLSGHVRKGRMEAVRPDIDEWIRRYDASIAAADQQVGAILAELKALGRYDEAMILVTSDHGESLDERHWVLDHGSRVSDEQVLVPLLVKLPHRIHAGRRVDEQVAHIDFLRTIADVVGLELNDTVEGRSLLTLLGDGPHEDVPAYSLARRVLVRLSDVPAKVPPKGKTGERASLVASVRLPQAKFIDYSGLESSEGSEVFHDLEVDPEERANALESEPEAAGLLRGLLHDWWFREDRRGGTRDELPDDVAEELRALGYIE